MRRISTGSPLEPVLGYSRAVVAGGVVYISGCSGLARRDGEEVQTAAAQVDVAVAKIAAVLHGLGADLDAVVSTRVYLTREEDWDAVGAAHGTHFGHIRPASTMVQVSRLVDPRMRIEIEATAVLPEPS